MKLRFLRYFGMAMLALMALSFLLLVLGGCASAEKNVGKAQARSAAVERKIAKNVSAQQEKLRREIFAVQVALENQSVVLALDYNARAQSIIGLPPAGQMTAVRRLIAGLLSENAELRAKAQRTDARSVAELTALQTENAKLRAELGESVTEERTAATRAAGELGDLKGKVNSWFGLGAIGYGVKRVVTWFLVLGALFLVGVAALFLFPATAPVALSIFSALWRMASGAVSLFIRFLAWASEGLINYFLKLLIRRRK